MKGKQLITLPNKGNIIFPPPHFFFPPFSSVSTDVFFFFFYYSFPLYSLFSFALLFILIFLLNWTALYQKITNGNCRFVNSVVGRIAWCSIGFCSFFFCCYPAQDGLHWHRTAVLSFSKLVWFFLTVIPPHLESHLTLWSHPALRPNVYWAIRSKITCACGVCCHSYNRVFKVYHLVLSVHQSAASAEAST